MVIRRRPQQTHHRTRIYQHVQTVHDRPLGRREQKFVPPHAVPDVLPTPKTQNNSRGYFIAPFCEGQTRTAKTGTQLRGEGGHKQNGGGDRGAVRGGGEDRGGTGEGDNL